MTEKLYWQDPHVATFETQGVRVADYQGKTAVVLERTLFYPEGGGQLGDVGSLTIGDVVANVVDTQIDDGGIIHHVLEGPVTFDASARVEGRIDLERRLDHMAQHTGQHALSRALADEARAETVSARLGATSCTIDLARPSIHDSELHKAEDLVNAIIRSDVVVRSHFPNEGELAKMPLRRQPKVSEEIRVIEIEGFDFSPCGGTHVTRTGQIGQARIVGIEKYKGGVRVTFHAGLRALADARAKHAVLVAASADLTCGVLDVPAAIGKLRADLKATRTALDGAREELAGLVAKAARDALPPASERPSPIVVPLLRANDDVTALRVLAGKLSEDTRVVALAGGIDPQTGELVLVVQRGRDAGLDCGAFVKAQAAQRNGRGGGKAERAEGRFPRGTSLEVLAAAASSMLQA